MVEVEGEGKGVVDGPQTNMVTIAMRVGEGSQMEERSRAGTFRHRKASGVIRVICTIHLGIEGEVEEVEEVGEEGVIVEGEGWEEEGETVATASTRVRGAATAVAVAVAAGVRIRVSIRTSIRVRARVRVSISNTLSISRRVDSRL